MGCLFLHLFTILSADPTMNSVSVWKSLCPYPLVFACWGFGWDSWWKSPFLSKKLCFLHISGSYWEFSFPVGFLELCFKFRYSASFQVNMPAVGTEFSFTLLEIQQLFIVINVIFSKGNPNPNFWVQTLEIFICIQPLCWLALTAMALGEAQLWIQARGLWFGPILRY